MSQRIISPILMIIVVGMTASLLISGSLNTIVGGVRLLLTELDVKQQALLQKKLALTEEFAEIECGLAEELRLAGVEKADPADFLNLKAGLEDAEQNIALFVSC